RPPALDDRLGQLAMLRGVDDVDATSEHSERFAVSVEGTLMRLAVDAAREPAHESEPFGGELEAEPLRHPAADVAGRARTDDCDGVAVSQRRRTADDQERRRIRNLAQVWRIVGVGPFDEPRADIRQLAPFLLERLA